MENNKQHDELKLSSVLRSLLKHREMTASQLSRSSKVPKSVLSDWLSGTSPRNIPQLMRVAKILGVSLEMLCFGVDEHAEFSEGRRLKGVFEGEIIIVKRF